MKVAVLCAGLGSVTRGFERFTDDLGKHLEGEIEMTIFGSFGDRATTSLHRIPSMSRDGVLSKIAWTRDRPGRNPYYWECLTFLLSALPALMRGRFDVIHVMDPPVVNFLHRLRSLPGLGVPIIFTNGIGMRDRACERATHLHEVSQGSYEQSLSYIEAGRLSMIPYPIDELSLRSSMIPKERARRDLGLEQHDFVVLSVSALNRSHKRTHHLIEEVAQVPGVTLLCVGRVEDATLPVQGRARLGERFVQRMLPFDRIGAAYSAADVFTLGSLEEGFAMAAVEAILAEVPAVLHRSPHFEWLSGGDDYLVDMTTPGALADKIGSLRSDPPSRSELEARRQLARARFTWLHLKESYIEMYERVGASSG